MHNDYDVLVLGGGIAGVAAALAAAQVGGRVCLVRAGPAVTALSLGGWRGAVPDGVREALAGAGLQLEPCARPLPRPDGTLLHADAAPRSHARASLIGERTLICGIGGLSGFHAGSLAALWADAAHISTDLLQSVTLTLADSPESGWSPPSLAALLERDAARLADPLARAATAAGVARVIVPAVLGLEAHAAVHASIEMHAAVIVGEALGTTPSLPGWRLDAALREALRRGGIPLLAGRVVAHQRTAQRLDAVTVAGDDGQRTMRAPAIVLATGKFMGGGMVADPVCRETALGCPVGLRRFGRSFHDATDSLLLTSELRTDTQPMLGVGICTNAESNPVYDSGDVIYDNVFVAGSIRAGVETASLGLGDAAADGWNAGLHAAAHARVMA